MFTSTTAAPPQKKRVLRGRRLVVVDIENVVGGAVATREMAEWGRSVVEASLQVMDGEQIVIGTCHVGLFNAKAAWTCARVKVRSGEDGADIELLDVLTNEGIEGRFDEVVLVSGDGIFADAVSKLSGRGVPVTVASWVESMSAKLRLAASQVVYLDDWAASHTYKEIA